MNIVDRVMATQKEILGDKITAGEEEEERLKAQRQAEAEDGPILRSEPQQTWSQPQQRQQPQHQQYPAQQPQHQAPPQPRMQPRRQRPQQTSDDEEGFQGIGGSDQW
jgi:hypothetical protein